MRSVWTSLICSLVAFELVAATRYGVRTWSLEEGLPSSQIVDIDQAEDGRLWLATSRGIAVFDGIEFLNYSHVETPELGASDLTALEISPQGWVWFSDRSGKVGYYDGRQFHNIDLPLLAPDDYVQALVINGNELVVGATRGGSVIEIHPNEVSSIWKPNQWFELEREFSPGLQTIFDGQDQLWAGLHTELIIWSPNGLIHALPELHVDTSENEPWVWALGRSPRGGVWVAADQQLRRYLDGQWLEHRGEFPWGYDGDVTSILESRTGVLWVAGRGKGLRGFLENGSSINLVESDELPTGDVVALFEDREGNLWLGSDGGGLTRIRPELFEGFEVYDDNVSFGEVRVNSIIEDATHDLWIATDGKGLLHWDGDRMRSVLKPDKPITTVLLRDWRGRVWVGTEQRGLVVIYPGSNPLEGNEAHPVEAFDGLTITSLFEDSARGIWVATERGLGRLPRGLIEAELSPFFDDLKDVRCLEEDGDGRLWIGTHGRGVFRWNGTEMSSYSQADDLPDDTVTAMCRDDEGQLWLGTLGGGLATFDGDRFQGLGDRVRLADGFISGMVNDGVGALWLSTGRGISRIEWDELKQGLSDPLSRIRERNFGREDGLTHLEGSGAYHPSILRSELGKLYFPQKKGVVHVSTDQLREEAAWVPLVSIRDVLVDGVAAELRQVDGRAEVTIEPGGRRVEIRFAGVGFSAPEKVIYRYRIAGRDEGWISIGGTRSVSFLELEPGEYPFELTAALQSGPWNPKPVQLSIRAKPHWWERATVKWGSVAGLVGIVGLGIWRYSKRRIREAERERALQEALVKERERIAQDMHDDLGARLTQLSFQGELARRSLDNPSAIEQGVDQVLVGIRQTAQALDDIVWMTNPKNDSLERLISHLAHVANEMVEGIQWRMDLSLPEGVPSCVVTGRCRHELVMVVKEVINNAGKYSEGDCFRFDISIESQSLCLHLRDNGRGFDLEGADERGNGLAQMKDRIRSIRGDISLTSQPGQGTQVEIQVPIEMLGK